jgi:hypothetical protein
MDMNLVSVVLMYAGIAIASLSAGVSFPRAIGIACGLSLAAIGISVWHVNFAKLPSAGAEKVSGSPVATRVGTPNDSTI